MEYDNAARAGVRAPEPQAKMEKHDDLYNAVARIDATVESVRRLLDKIAGNPQPDITSGTETPVLCLSEVLDSMPTIIRDKCDEIEAIVGEIRGRLF